MTYIIPVLDSKNLFSKILKIVEGRLRSNGVDQDKTLSVLHVQISHSSELFLSKYVCKLGSKYVCKHIYSVSM